MKKLSLRNDFHNTEVVILAYDDETPFDAWERIQEQAGQSLLSRDPARRRLRRVERVLCGLDCACGTVRGPQD